MINITNYFDHPKRIGFTIFKFSDKQRAEYFEELLKKDGIWYETSYEDEKSLHLFGVKKGDFKKAMNANYLVSAKFRKKIIPNSFIRWGVIVLAIFSIILAIIGAIIKT